MEKSLRKEVVQKQCHLAVVILVRWLTVKATVANVGWLRFSGGAQFPWNGHLTNR